MRRDGRSCGAVRSSLLIWKGDELYSLFVCAANI